MRQVGPNLLLAIAAAAPQKRVLYTSWWPPGTEEKSESVGIVSGDLVFTTGMMENNFTDNQTCSPRARIQIATNAQH